MYTSSRRNSTGTQLGETDKDRKMRLVGDSNRRASRQLAKQLTHIDKHLQVNLKQINGEAETKVSSVSPPLPLSSPRYLASSSDSLESSSQSSSYGLKLTYRASDQSVPGHGDRTANRKPKSQSTTHRQETDGRETEGKLIQPREKTFTIIDHGLASEDADSVTGDNPNAEIKARGRTLDALDNTRLLQGGCEKPTRTNIRNEMALTSYSRKQTLLGDRPRDENGKLVRQNGRNREGDLYKVPGRKGNSRGQILGTISSNQTGEPVEYRKEAFSLNEGGQALQSRYSVSRGKNAVKNIGQMPAKDELNRRQLKKMHILSNLNKKHMDRDPSNDNMDVFVSRDHDARVSRAYDDETVTGAGVKSEDSTVELEKPRPKSALFSSHRRPRFTSDDDNDVFLDDLDIIDIDDDGESSDDDDDNLNSSFVAPLKSSSRHRLGLHTRSTSDISPSNFRHREQNHFRVARTQPRISDKNSLKIGAGKNSSEDNLSSDTCAFSQNENLSNRRSSGDGGVGKEKYAGDKSIQTTAIPAINSKGNVSPKSETDSSLNMTNKETTDMTVSPRAGLEGARPVPVFPRKLKPLFKPDNAVATGEVSPTVGDHLPTTDSGTPTSPKSDSQLSPKLLQRASSHMYYNKKLSRSRQKTWTAGVGATGARDLLKRPLPPTSMGSKPRAKSNLTDVTRPIPRRRARTSSELKKCSTKELQTLKSGDIPEPDIRETGPVEKEDQASDLADGLRNCRYLRTTSDSDSLSSAVNVETC